MKKLIWLLSLSLLTTVGSFAEENKTQSAESNSTVINNKNVMSITDITGKVMKVEALKNGLYFQDFKDKVIFLEFFGHRCPPCKKSIPHYIDLQNKFKDKLAIIAIEVQGLSRKQLSSFAKKKGINYITVAQEDSQILLEHISVRANWSGAIPYLVILDQKGDVQTMQAGLIPQKPLEDIVNGLTTTTVVEDNNETNDTNKSKK